MDLERERHVRELIANRLGVKVEKTVPAARLVGDLGADSLDEIELCMALEDEFDVKISDEEMQRAIAVRDLVALVDEKA